MQKSVCAILRATEAELTTIIDRCYLLKIANNVEYEVDCLKNYKLHRLNTSRGIFAFCYHACIHLIKSIEDMK